MTPLISYKTSKNWQRRAEQRTLTMHILLCLGWWVRTDNSDDGGVCARIHGCLLFKSSCFILLHLLRQIFRESFMLKTTTTTKNLKMESMWPHLRTVQEALDINPCWLGTGKWGFGQPLFTQDAREPCKCHYTVQHLLSIWVVFTQALLFIIYFLLFSGDVPCLKGQNDQ